MAVYSQRKHPSPIRVARSGVSAMHTAFESHMEIERNRQSKAPIVMPGGMVARC